MPPVDVNVFPTSDAGPNDGTLVGAGTHYGCVAQAVNDGDTTYLSFTAPGSERFGLGVTGLKSGDRITNVRLLYSVKSAGDDFNLTTGLVLNGIESSTLETVAAGGGWQDFQRDFATNPQTGRRWTYDDIATAVLMVDVNSVPGTLPRPRIGRMLLVVTVDNGLLHQVVNAVLVAVQGISGIGDTGTDPKPWHIVTSFPAAYVTAPAERKTRYATQGREAVAGIVVSCVVKGVDPVLPFVELYRSIEIAVEADPTLGGLTLDCVVVGFDAGVTAAEIHAGWYAADVFLEVTYRHAKGAP